MYKADDGVGKDMFEFGGELYEDDDEGEDDWDLSRMLASYVRPLSSHAWESRLKESREQTIRDRMGMTTMQKQTMKAAMKGLSMGCLMG